MREETQALSTYCFKKEVLSSNAESSPWDQGAGREVTLVPSDRGGLDGGRGLQWNLKSAELLLGAFPLDWLTSTALPAPPGSFYPRPCSSPCSGTLRSL